jgi:hypothetical protein
MYLIVKRTMGSAGFEPAAQPCEGEGRSALVSPMSGRGETTTRKASAPSCTV